MIKTLKFLLNKQMKRSKDTQQVGGFTLIELLVAMILAVLVITPLLGFMINVMDTDRKEQAKATSEQEIQAALDYIARDLQQAIYIYNAAGIEAIKTELPSPSTTDRVPVLVFWKRELVNQVVPVTASDKNDTFVYSLVAYYLIKDSSTTWSQAARIARWQIRDGVPATTGGVSCTAYSSKYVNTDNCPSPGFALFKIDGIGSLEEKMNSWKRLGEYKATENGVEVTKILNYTADPIVLIDFVDQTKTDDSPAAPSATCPSDTTTPPITWSKVAPNTASFNTRNTYKMTGFYACVDRANTTAQVFIRGNALARIENDANKIKNRGESNKTYFPTASVRVQGRGYLYTK